MMSDKAKLMIVLGSGGHTTQMLKIAKTLSDLYEFEYVVNDDDDHSQRKIQFFGEIHVLPRPRRVYDNFLIRSAVLTIWSVIKSFQVVRKSSSIAIISAGPGIAVPLFIWATIFRKKRVFIESWSRVTEKSMTGRICYHLSDLFFIQWPELAKKYPKAVYAGRIG